MGRTVLLIGIVIALFGLVMMLGVPIGRLPGDLSVRRGSVSFYVPITSSIIVSVVLTLIMALFRR